MNDILETSNKDEFYKLLRVNNCVIYKEELFELIFFYVIECQKINGITIKIKKNREAKILVGGEVITTVQIANFRGQFLDRYINLAKKYIKLNTQIQRIGVSLSYFIDEFNYDRLNNQRKKFVGMMLDDKMNFEAGCDFDTDFLEILRARRILRKINNNEYTFTIGFIKGL